MNPLIATFENGCIVDTKNRTITFGTSTEKLRNHCWIILEALLEATQHNWCVDYNLLANLIWNEPIADLSRIKAIQGCLVDIRKKLNINIHNEPTLGYRIVENVNIKDSLTVCSNITESRQRAIDISNTIDSLLSDMENLQKKISTLNRDKDEFWYRTYESALLAKGFAVEELRENLDELIKCKKESSAIYKQIADIESQGSHTDVPFQYISGYSDNYNIQFIPTERLSELCGKLDKLDSIIYKNILLFIVVNTTAFETEEFVTSSKKLILFKKTDYKIKNVVTSANLMLKKDIFEPYNIFMKKTYTTNFRSLIQKTKKE